MARGLHPLGALARTHWRQTDQHRVPSPDSWLKPAAAVPESSERGQRLAQRLGGCVQDSHFRVPTEKMGQQHCVPSTPKVTPITTAAEPSERIYDSFRGSGATPSGCTRAHPQEEASLITKRSPTINDKTPDTLTLLGVTAFELVTRGFSVLCSTN